MIESNEHFAAAFRWLLENKPRKNLTQKGIAKKIGKTQGYIGKISRGERSGTENVRRRIAAIYGYDGTGPGCMYDDFIALGRQILTGSEPDPKNQNEHHLKVVDIEHRNIIEAFRNKPLAREINEKLLAIEKADPERLEEIRDYIDLIYERLERKKIVDENSG